MRSSGADIRPALLRLIDGALEMFNVDLDVAQRYLLCALTLLRSRYPARADALELVRGGLAMWQISRVMDYIERHLADRIKGQDLAAQVNLSTGQMNRAFRVSFGTSPLRYITLRRIELACTIMKATRAPLSQVADATGMCDEAHLCRVFRRAIGVSPGAWRRANARQPEATRTFR